jgi:hypothetical protein
VWRAAFEPGLSRLSTTSWSIPPLLLQLLFHTKPILYLLPFLWGDGCYRTPGHHNALLPHLLITHGAQNQWRHCGHARHRAPGRTHQWSWWQTPRPIEGTDAGSVLLVPSSRHGGSPWMSSAEHMARLVLFGQACDDVWSGIWRGCSSVSGPKAWLVPQC